MFTAAELAEHRADAESLMTLDLRAYEPAGKSEDADGYEVQIYTDKGKVRGKVQAGSTQGRDSSTRYIEIGDVRRPVLEGGLHIPLCADLPTPGEQRGLAWEYEVISAECSADLALVGRRFLVVEVPAKSYATARRLNVVEVSA